MDTSLHLGYITGDRCKIVQSFYFHHIVSAVGTGPAPPADLLWDKHTHKFHLLQKGKRQRPLSQLHDGEKGLRGSADEACSSRERVKMYSWHRPTASRAKAAKTALQGAR